MGGLQRLRSKREKRSESPSSKRRLSTYLTGSAHLSTHQPKEVVDPNSVADFHSLFADSAKASSAEESKIKSLRQKVIASKSVLIKDENILWSLRCNFSEGDAASAYDLLIAMLDASEGIIIPYNPRTKLLGAVNRQAVTCYLDAVLFAMFSRLDSFEAMLYNTFEDQPRNRLAFLLRLWVNLLRAGKLITTDITMNIQQVLSECGWTDAARIRQQDASEAFACITEKLQLPLLTLKMDMFHEGKQDADDHKFINERLLEVAIPAEQDGENSVKLEDCLEDYFNNRIEVRRFLERRPTINLKYSIDSSSKEKSGVYVETVEVEDSDSALTPLSPRASYTIPSRPALRSRGTSIVQERHFLDAEEKTTSALSNGVGLTKGTRSRTASVRKEVLMPAWQFFSLIPWYTNTVPSSDAQVADHFSSKRPILGLCLKRYQTTATGEAVRLGTNVDIPVEIGLPYFIQDDKMNDEGPLYGNFKLSLQSVVCHRGSSVHSGHYISLVRRKSLDQNAEPDGWMRFDDLATQKIAIIDIHQALRDEMPYLLFYQIVPVDGDPGNVTMDEKTPSRPPSYTESGTDSRGQEPSLRSLSRSPELAKSGTDSQPPSTRPSFELTPPDNHQATAAAGEKRRPSSAFLTEAFGLNKSSRHSSQDRSGRKSALIGRSISRGSKSLSKTLGTMTGTPKGNDDRPMSIIPEPHSSLDDIDSTRADALARLTGEIETPVAVSAEASETEQSRGRSDKRDKSKNRLTKTYASKEEKPDRECSVM